MDGMKLHFRAVLLTNNPQCISGISTTGILEMHGSVLLN